MGKLRTEPKRKEILSGSEYQNVLSILQKGMNAARDHFIYYDLEEEEGVKQVKRSFSYVAEKEGIDVVIRQVRGTKSLSFNFKRGKPTTKTRMSARESRARILECLRHARRPLKKNHIIRETGISASTWNIRIKELMQLGHVRRHGNRRDTTYTLIGGSSN